MANIDQRRQTLQRIVAYLVSFQGDYLANGVRHLRPLTRAMVAAELGVHESTVSRATASKYVMLPTGEVVPLSHFFTPSLSAKDVIKDMIEHEAEPLTDEQIAEGWRRRGSPSPGAPWPSTASLRASSPPSCANRSLPGTRPGPVPRCVRHTLEHACAARRRPEGEADRGPRLRGLDSCTVTHWLRSRGSSLTSTRLTWGNRTSRTWRPSASGCWPAGPSRPPCCRDRRPWPRPG